MQHRNSIFSDVSNTLSNNPCWCGRRHLLFCKKPRFLFFVTHKVTHITTWTWIFFISINKFHIDSVIDEEIKILKYIIFNNGTDNKKK